MTSSPFRIRPFTAADSQALVDVYNQARPIEVAQLTEERFWSWFSDPALDPTRDILVAEDAQGPVGMVAIFPWPNHLEEGYVFFVGPSVLPEFQHHGVGRLLMQALEGHVAARYPGKRLETRSQQGNEAAHAFLTGPMGFTVERQFWQMTHPAPGKTRPAEPPEGISFDYLDPREDPQEAVSVYCRILDDPMAAHHLLTADELANWASLKHYGANSFLVARAEGRIVGLCFQAFPPTTDFGQIQFLGVLPEMRGRGVALQLLTRALADAHSNGRRCVRLEVGGDDATAQALYRRLGFEVTGGEVFFQKSLAAAVGG